MPNECFYFDLNFENFPNEVVASGMETNEEKSTQNDHDKLMKMVRSSRLSTEHIAILSASMLGFRNTRDLCFHFFAVFRWRREKKGG